jgi:hypothetical protein
MHAILLKNKQLALKEELDKKQTITSLALNSIKQIVRSNKPKTNDDGHTGDAATNLAGPATSPAFFTSRLATVLVLLTFFGFWILTGHNKRLSQVPNGQWREDMAELTATVKDLREKVEAQEITLAALRRDLTSGLRELQREK